MKSQVLAILAQLKDGATACPGEVARKLGTTQRELRPLLGELAESGAIAVFQRGAPAELRVLRGPYRIGRRR